MRICNRFLNENKTENMNRFLNIIILAFVSNIIFAQSSYTVTSDGKDFVVTIGKYAKEFFKSYEDYAAGTPIEGVKLKELKSSSIKYTENGTEQKAKASKSPYAWFCNEDGMLMRIYDGDIYYMVVDGPISFYIKSGDGKVWKPDSYDYNISGELSDSYPNEYCSLTPNGPIEKLKENFLEEYLTKYNLKNAYDKDPKYRREGKDCVMCWQNKKSNKQIKYIKLLNEKMK